MKVNPYFFCLSFQLLLVEGFSFSHRFQTSSGAPQRGGSDRNVSIRIHIMCRIHGDLPLISYTSL
jgi:hypothetical protein